MSPSYLTARPGNLTQGIYSRNTNVIVTPLIGNGTASYFVVRHSDYASLATTNYTLRLPTSDGTIVIPQFREKLSLGRRDSKIHVVDYAVGNVTLLYSTAEIFTWKQYQNKTVLLVYGGAGETHEMAIKTTATPVMAEGSDMDINVVNGNLVLTWETSETRRVVQVDQLFVYVLGR